MTDKDDYASRLKRVRETLKMGQAAFGGPLGLSGTVIGHIEARRTKLKTEHALLIEKMHGINMLWLLNGEGEMFVKEKSDVVIGVSGDVSGHGNAIVTTHHGPVVVRNGDERSLSDEASELLRLYEGLDVKRRMELLSKAFALEEEALERKDDGL